MMVETRIDKTGKGTMTKPLAIELSAQEMIFLAGSLGADMLLGIDDPYRGWLANEIEEAGKQVQDSLEERQFIRLQPDVGIVLDVAVAAMVRSCAFPQASFVVTTTSSDGGVVPRYLHVAPHLAVEQVLMTELSDTYRLTAIEGGGTAVYRRILEILGLDGQQAAAAHGGELPEVNWLRAREAVAEHEFGKAREILQEGGLSDTTAFALVETLGTLVFNSALLALARRETTWEVAGLGVLEGQNGLWRLRAFTRNGKNWVEVIPCDADAARRAIRRVMNRVLPERI